MAPGGLVSRLPLILQVRTIRRLLDAGKVSKALTEGAHFEGLLRGLCANDGVPYTPPTPRPVVVPLRPAA